MFICSRESTLNVYLITRNHSEKLDKHRILVSQSNSSRREENPEDYAVFGSWRSRKKIVKVPSTTPSNDCQKDTSTCFLHSWVFLASAFRHFCWRKSISGQECLSFQSLNLMVSNFLILHDFFSIYCRKHITQCLHFNYRDDTFQHVKCCSVQQNSTLGQC